MDVNALATCTHVHVGIRFKPKKDDTDLQLVFSFISIGTTDTSDVGAGDISNSNKGVTN